MLISDFARLGQVSVRMLRHYDALGLLVPDHVEPASGYRSYSPEQLHLLTGWRRSSRCRGRPRTPARRAWSCCW